MGRTFSLKTLLLLTAVIAGWLVRQAKLRSLTQQKIVFRSGAVRLELAVRVGSLFPRKVRSTALAQPGPHPLD